MSVGVGFDDGEDGSAPGPAAAVEGFVVCDEAMLGDLHPGLHGFYSMVVC